MSALASKRGVVGLALLGALFLIASASRTWVTGTVDDAVLGASRVAGTGSQLASGLVALALAAAAAAIATTTSGRVVRRFTAAALMLAAVGAEVQTVRVLADPSGALGSVAARSTGRTGSIETHASTGLWPWIALVATVLLVIAGVGATVGSGRWTGLSSRYEAPTSPAEARDGDGSGTATRGAREPGASTARGSRGERVASDWDQLSSGVDPTEGDQGRPAAD